MNETVLFDFSKASDLYRWRIVDDVVMGGRSDGRFSLDEKGNGHFRGRVSLENNGGFSSLRYDNKTISVNDFSQICIVLKGDGKDYQIRTKRSRYDRHSYSSEISTSGEWETICLTMNDMRPTFRGYQLNIPNYPGDQLSEFAILIGNKRAEEFDLRIDKIYFK